MSSAAIQSAINALPENGGMVVFPPNLEGGPTEYKIDEPLTLRNGVTFFAPGDYGVQIMQTDTAADCLYGVISRTSR